MSVTHIFKIAETALFFEEDEEMIENAVSSLTKNSLQRAYHLIRGIYLNKEDSEIIFAEFEPFLNKSDVMDSLNEISTMIDVSENSDLNSIINDITNNVDINYLKPFLKIIVHNKLSDIIQDLFLHRLI